jgi:hypothetical protein
MNAARLRNWSQLLWKGTVTSEEDCLSQTVDDLTVSLADFQRRSSLLDLGLPRTTSDYEAACPPPST